MRGTTANLENSNLRRGDEKYYEKLCDLLKKANENESSSKAVWSNIQSYDVSV